MALAIFLSLACLTVIGIWCAKRSRRFYYLVFFALGLLACLTIRSYIFPGKKVYDNTKYHIFELLGLQFSDTLYLANEHFQELALWENKKGVFKLFPSQGQDVAYQLRDFHEPVFVQDSLQHKTYHLVNNLLPISVERGFEIGYTDSFGNKVPWIEMVIHEDASDSAQYILQSYFDGKHSHDKRLTSSFAHRLNVGFPLVNILLDTKLGLPDTLWQVLDGSYLIRSAYIHDTDIRNESPLYIFPGPHILKKGFYLKSLTNGQVLEQFHEPKDKRYLSKGQTFFTGLGGTKATTYWRSQRRGNQLQLLYDFGPKYHLKPGKKGEEVLEEDLFISSSTQDILQNDYDAGYHFPFFSHENHFLHFNGSVKYLPGSSRDSLVFQVIDQYQQTVAEDLGKIYHANDTIRLQATGYRSTQLALENGTQEAILMEDYGNKKVYRLANGETVERRLRRSQRSDPAFLANRQVPFHWLFQFQDLRATAPVQATDIYGTILGFLLCIFLVIFLKGTERTGTVEYVIYVVLFCLLVVRLILLWRASTFVPIENIDSKVFAKLRSPDYLHWTWIYTGIFFVLNLAYYYAKQGIDYLKPLRYVRVKWEPLAKDNQTPALWQWLIVFGASYLALIGLNFVPQLERFVNIAFPVLIYFLLGIPVYRATFQRRDMLQFDIWSDRMFWARTVNWLGCFGWLMINDAGYAIVFLLFSSLLGVFRRAMLANRHHGKSKMHQHAWAIGSLIPICLGIYHSTWLIEFVCEHILVFLYVGAFFSLMIGGFTVFKFYRGLAQDKTFSIIGMSLSSLIVLVAIGGSIWLSSKPSEYAYDRFAYIKFRAEIHNKALEEITRDIGFESYYSRKLLEASQNQWYINYFLNRELDSYFQLKEHFNKGVSYIAQTTDLVVLRYVIGEHPEWVVVCLVSLLFFIFVTLLLTSNISKGANLMVSGAALLLSVTGFFVWMTASNRFAFFGQDFPFLSITSRFTLIFTLSIFLLIILFNQEQNKEVQGSGQTDSIKGKRIHFLYLGAVLLCLVPVLFKGGAGLMKKEQITGSFTLAPTLQYSQTKINALNADFIAFQRGSEHSDIDSVVVDFREWIKQYQPLSYQRIMEPVDKDLFTKSIWEHYDSSSVDLLKDPKQILHLKYPESQYYEFALNNNYYLLRNPDQQTYAWQGDLLGAGRQEAHRIVYRSYAHTPSIGIPNSAIQGDIFKRAGRKFEDERADLPIIPVNNVRISSFPDSLSMDGEPLVLISLLSGKNPENKGNFSIVNSQDYLSTKGNSMNAFAYRLHPNDYINLYDDKNNPIQLKYTAKYEQYLAKNTWMNGKQKLFYPLEHKSTWAYNYANLVNNRMSTEENYRDDVEVSIDYELSERTYDLVDKRMRNGIPRDMCVTVMDEQGRVRMLLDYKKDQGTRFNPNNTEEFTELFQKFYLQSNRRSERLIFGNRTLQRLDNGPGSSIKPIMYMSVTSGVHIDWDQLHYIAPNAKEWQAALDTSGTKYQVKYYAGHPLPGRWQIRSDDPTHFDAKRYIVRSSNLYHSAVMFMGSYRKDQLDILKQGGLLSSTPIFDRPDQAHPENNFPKLRIGKELLVFTPGSDHWPPGGRDNIFGDNQSVLANQLVSNFQLPVQKSDEDMAGLISYAPRHISQKELHTSASSYRIWSYPEKSSFYQIDRSGKNYSTLGLRQSTVGGYPIEVTPLKMAEMGAKMMSQNQNLRATLEPSPHNEYTMFQTDGDWGSKEEWISFSQKQIYQPMEEVLESKGTAFALNKHLGEYHYYAKTGTIKGENTPRNDRHLLLIISKKDLGISKKNGKVLRPDDLKENTFYSVYISYFNSGSIPWNLTGEIVQEIEKSKLFKDHMEGVEIAVPGPIAQEEEVQTERVPLALNR